MERPSSTVRRRAWINSSRQWLNLEEQDSEELMCSLPSASTVDDDVFSDGCITGKIENWLLGCGSEVSVEKLSQLSFDSALKAKHLDNELILGVDASVRNVVEILSESGLNLSASSERSHCTLTTSTPRQALCLPSKNMGHSMASSCLTSTSIITMSLLEVLQLCSEDAEETLYELGFGCEEPQFTVRIPPRFFSFPSQAQGINFRLFLDSQLRRIRDEDPSLSLASRFRQVQVLTAMANAFYSLYSHVSRTPLQKLATPEFTIHSSPVERMERFRSSVRSEPRSPVERLKDTVSKMCLYTGSPLGSESTSPQPSPKKRPSLPDVGDFAREKVETVVVKKLDLESRTEVQRQETSTDSDTLHNGTKTCCAAMHCLKNSNDSVAENDVKTEGLDSRTQSVRTSLSGETVKTADNQFPLHQPELDSNRANSDAKIILLKPDAEVAQHLKFTAETEDVDGPSPPSCMQTAVSYHYQDCHTNPTRPLPVWTSKSSFTQCCITVTGWEGEDVSSCSPNIADSPLASTGPPVQTCKESFHEGNSQYLNPPQQQNLGPVSSNLQQVNSFELEEVHSAGEEDLGRLEPTTTSLFSKNGEVVRGDSTHSDSSGYAEDEASPSH